MSARALFSCLAVLAFALGADGAEPESQRSGRLRLASDSWPPFTDASGGMRVAIDLVETALDRAGVPVNNELRSDFSAVMIELKDGRLDGSPALWRDAERERFLIFSRPYLENRLVLLARKGKDVSSGLDALAGQRIGIVEDYAYGEGVTGVEGPVWVEGQSVQENLDRLIAGELDYVLADELLVHGLFERHGARARSLLVAGREPVLHRSLHLALRRDLPGAADLIARFDAEIVRMMADGTYNRILGLLWIQADVDGDGQREWVLGGDRAGSQAPDAGYPVFVPKGAKADVKAGTPYLVAGKKYTRWEQIPDEYRIPVEVERDPPRPGLRVVEW